MVERKVCSFCGGDIEPGTGRMYIKKDGTTYNFCSKKCRMNLVVLGRTPRWIKWTKNFIKVKTETEEPGKKKEKTSEKDEEESTTKKGTDKPEEKPKAKKLKADKDTEPSKEKTKPKEDSEAPAKKPKKE